MNKKIKLGLLLTIIIISLVFLILILTNIISLSNTAKKNLSEERKNTSINSNTTEIDNSLIKTITKKDGTNEIRVDYYARKCSGTCSINEDTEVKQPTYKIERDIYLNERLLKDIVGIDGYGYEADDVNDYVNKYSEQFSEYALVNDKYIVFNKRDYEDDTLMDGLWKLYIYTLNGELVSNITVQSNVSLICTAEECAKSACEKIDSNGDTIYLKYGPYANMGIEVYNDYFYYIVESTSSYDEYKATVKNGKLYKELINSYNKNSNKIKIGMI